MKSIFISILLASTFWSYGQSKLQFKKDVISNFIKRNQLRKSDSVKFVKNFEGLVTITKLTSPKRYYSFSYRKGIYYMALNITHTLSGLILYNSLRDYEILFVEGDELYPTFRRVVEFIKNDKNISKLESLDYLRAVLILRCGNEYLDRLLTVPDLDDKSPPKRVETLDCE